MNSTELRNKRENLEKQLEDARYANEVYGDDNFDDIGQLEYRISLLDCAEPEEVDCSGRRFWHPGKQEYIMMPLEEAKPILSWRRHAIRLLMAGILMFPAASSHAQELGKDQQRELVIETLLGEAADQGLDGMTAVAETIRNRAKQRRMSLDEVVLQPLQYSFWNNPERAERWLNTKVNWPSYRKAAHAYERAFGPIRSNITNGATHYYNPSRVKRTPRFAKVYEQRAKIGDHVFFYGA